MSLVCAGFWRWPTLLACSLLSLAAGAQGTTVPAPASGTSATLTAAEARSWLSRMHAAARGGNYQGTLVYSIGGQVSSSRVWHFSVADQAYERLEAQDGRQQRIVRHNDLVHTFWPQSKVAVVERREMLAAWSTTPQAVDPLALEQYELRREGSARVAGREAAVLMLSPRDGLRYARIRPRPRLGQIGRARACKAKRLVWFMKKVI